MNRIARKTLDIVEKVAKEEGVEVTGWQLTNGGHMRVDLQVPGGKPGPVYSSSTPSCSRWANNAKTNTRRVIRKLKLSSNP